MLATLFERCMKRRGVKDSDPYDWEKLDNSAHLVGNNNQSNMPSNIQSHIQAKTDQIHGVACNNSAGAIAVIGTGNATTQMTIAGTNPIDMDYVSANHILFVSGI